MEVDKSWGEVRSMKIDSPHPTRRLEPHGADAAAHHLHRPINDASGRDEMPVRQPQLIHSVALSKNGAPFDSPIL